MKNIGDIIREHRIRKNLTQEALGKMVFVSKQAVSKWETGRTLPDLETLRKLASILDIKNDEILGGTVEEAKRSKKWSKWLIIIALITLLCSVFFVLGVPEYIDRHTQSGITFLTVYRNDKLLAADEYTVDCLLPTKDAQNGYQFESGYGEIRGTVYIDGYEIEYGFINPNNWHNIQIRLDIEQQEEVCTVRQTVTYQTDAHYIEVFVTESTASIESDISVFRDGV